MDADATSDEGVMPLDSQVVDRASADVFAADDRPKVAVLINQAIVRSKAADCNERVELVQNPVVRGGIQRCAAPELITHHALIWVLMHLQNRCRVQLALVVKTQDSIASLQLINSALAIRRAHQRVPKEASTTTTAAA